MIDISARTSFVLGLASLILAPLGFFPGILSLFGCVGAIAGIFALSAGFNGLGVIKHDDKLNRTLAIIGIVSAGLALLMILIALGLSTWNYFTSFR